MTLGIAALALAGALASPRASGADGPACQEVVLRRAKPMMATLVTVTVRGCAADGLEDRVREAFSEMERLAGILSEWAPDSPVSRINRDAGGAPVQVPRELLDVLEAAVQVSERTAGAFDATWGALGDLWRFDGARPPRLPAAGEVSQRRALVGYRDLVLDRAAGTARLRRPGMRLGLGGIAKGYIAQAAADLLRARGVRDVLVAASGDIAARGRNGDRPWAVAIRDARDPSGAYARVELHDESVSTSGDYERFFVVDGRRYHHLLDPRTGYPATESASVTVIAPDGALADALATGLFVLGPDRAEAVVRGLSKVSALLVDPHGAVRVAGDPRRFAFPERERSAPAASSSAADQQ